MYSLLAPARLGHPGVLLLLQGQGSAVTPSDSDKGREAIEAIIPLLSALVDEALEQYDNGYAVDLEGRYPEVARAVLDALRSLCEDDTDG
jgi:hypothetical protein